MLPYISIFSYGIPTFTVLLWLGAVATIILAIIVLEKMEKMKKSEVNRLLLLGGIAGACFGFFAVFFNSLFHSIKRGELTVGGITWLGGVIGAFPVAVWLFSKFSKGKKQSGFYLLGLLIPAVCVGHAIGRIGCFFAGCCYGKPTDGIFGVQFPLLNHKVYPTQLFEAVFELVLFTVLILTFKKTKKYYLPIYLIAYGVFRFFLEFLRGDDRGGTGFALSPSQLMSIIIVVAAVIMIWFDTFKKPILSPAPMQPKAHIYEKTDKVESFVEKARDTHFPLIEKTENRKE